MRCCSFVYVRSFSLRLITFILLFVPGFVWCVYAFHTYVPTRYYVTYTTRSTVRSFTLRSRSFVCVCVDSLFYLRLRLPDFFTDFATFTTLRLPRFCLRCYVSYCVLIVAFTRLRSRTFTYVYTYVYVCHYTHVHVYTVTFVTLFTFTHAFCWVCLRSPTLTFVYVVVLHSRCYAHTFLPFTFTRLPFVAFLPLRSFVYVVHVPVPTLFLYVVFTFFVVVPV